MASKKDEKVSAYSDITDAEHEDVVAEKQVRRAGQNNGGGPWPKDLLLARSQSKKVKRT